MTVYGIEQRLLDKCSPEPMSGCWLWFGAHQPVGYGQMWNGSRPEQAHRISYRIYRGPIPLKLEIDHVCHERSCVNPDHLRAVTHAQNIATSNTLMGINARKTECKRGHPLAGDNLRIDVSGNRQCRICINLRGRIAKGRKRARLL